MGLHTTAVGALGSQEKPKVEQKSKEDQLDYIQKLIYSFYTGKPDGPVSYKGTALTIAQHPVQNAIASAPMGLGLMALTAAKGAPIVTQQAKTFATKHPNLTEFGLTELALTNPITGIIAGARLLGKLWTHQYDNRF